MADETSSTSSGKAGKGGATVRTAFPVGSFEGEGFPTITSEGTDLTSAELKTAEEAAAEHGVTLMVEDGS
jgi:hypothetical protein